jgi:hypothetical protein
MYPGCAHANWMLKPGIFGIPAASVNMFLPAPLLARGSLSTQTGSGDVAFAALSGIGSDRFVHEGD